jgi:hypothetical protein
MTQNGTVLRDLFAMVCSEQIGSGMQRRVFRSALFPESVFKIEENAKSFQNIIEWETWSRIKYTPHARWFAPCEEISACGAVLKMARTSPALPEKFPARVPAFFTDLKRENFGLYKNRLVAHDYGVHLLMEEGMTKRLKKAEWWSINS